MMKLNKEKFILQQLHRKS